MLPIWSQSHPKCYIRKFTSNLTPSTSNLTSIMCNYFPFDPNHILNAIHENSHQIWLLYHLIQLHLIPTTFQILYTKICIEFDSFNIKLNKIMCNYFPLDPNYILNVIRENLHQIWLFYNQVQLSSCIFTSHLIPITFQMLIHENYISFDSQ